MDERDDPARRLKRAIERCIEQGRLKRLGFILATIAGASISVNQIAQTPANVLDAFNHLVEEVDELKELGPGPRELPSGEDPTRG